MESNPLVIAGSGRSGTTWVLDVLAEANNLRPVFEPLNPDGVNEARDFAIRLYKEARATFAYREDPVFVMYRHDSHLYCGCNLNKSKQVMEARLYLLRKYSRCYDLTNNEKRILNEVFSKRLVSLSSIHRMKKEYQTALSCTLESFKYSLSLEQLEEIMKVIVRCFQNPKGWFS